MTRIFMLMMKKNHCWRLRISRIPMTRKILSELRIWQEGRLARVATSFIITHWTRLEALIAKASMRNLELWRWLRISRGGMDRPKSYSAYGFLYRLLRSVPLQSARTTISWFLAKTCPCIATNYCIWECCYSSISVSWLWRIPLSSLYNSFSAGSWDIGTRSCLNWSQCPWTSFSYSDSAYGALILWTKTVLASASKTQAAAPLSTSSK